MHTVIIHIILIGIIFALFLMATADKINGRGVLQQVLEKEVALLVDSAVPGMSFEVRKLNQNGIVQDVSLKDGRIWISVNGLKSLKGYPYFSRYNIGVRDEGNKFVVFVE